MCGVLRCCVGTLRRRVPSAWYCVQMQLFPEVSQHTMYTAIPPVGGVVAVVVDTPRVSCQASCTFRQGPKRNRSPGAVEVWR